MHLQGHAALATSLPSIIDVISVQALHGQSGEVIRIDIVATLKLTVCKIPKETISMSRLKSILSIMHFNRLG